ncbi:hypothetical protein OG713_41930 [Streptomyces sp. NBC_00723]|uniref:hypothetical protein n=1 Tax=Streptomyces sp. NBC_00723 TaxID=2903673 RepID=UPI00386FD674
MDPELLERITARRAEPDELEERLAKQLADARAERDELAVAERVLERVSEQLADERASAAPTLRRFPSDHDHPFESGGVLVTVSCPRLADSLA